MTKGAPMPMEAQGLFEEACRAQHCVVDRLCFLSECLKYDPSFGQGIILGLAFILEDIQEQVFESVSKVEEALRLQKESPEACHG